MSSNVSSHSSITEHTAPGLLPGRNVAPLAHNGEPADGRGKISGARPKPNCPTEIEHQRSIGCGRSHYRHYSAGRRSDPRYGTEVPA